jgi:prepilin-type N-terminal cleavage/methylation domain-containing protein
MKPAPSSKTRGGFTLLEVMLALSLLAIVLVAIYSTWNAIVKGSRVALNAAAASQRARMSISTLHDALLSACMFSENNRYYSFVGESDNDSSSLSFTARLPPSGFLRGGRFGDLVVRRLSFRVENGPGSTPQLVLRQAPLLMAFDKEGKEVFDSSERDNPLVLARDVNKFLIEYLNPKTGDWDTEWTSTNDLPKMVRVTLALGHLEGFASRPQETMFDVVQLPAQAVRREWQMPQLGPGQINNNLRVNNGQINNNQPNNGQFNNSKVPPR